MAQMDPEQERQRLAATYARFTDGELQRTAMQGADLTELAQQILQVEIDRRGLNLEEDFEPLPENPAPIHTDQENLVTIRRFRDLPEALLAKGSLESAGIECSLLDDNMVRLDWFWSNLLGGMRLQVSPEDADSAFAILEQPIPEDLEVPGVGDYHQPHCPKCQSLDIGYKELNKPVAYISAYLSLPIPLERRAWRCHSCHAEWEQDDASTESDGKSGGDAFSSEE
jgi:hypothetical protein